MKVWRDSLKECSSISYFLEPESSIGEFSGLITGSSYLALLAYTIVPKVFEPEVNQLLEDEKGLILSVLIIKIN